jgi:hypothetical protein
VICVDEFGPLNLLPRMGKAWRQQARPKRLRATYHRYDRWVGEKLYVICDNYSPHRNADVRTWCADNQIPTYGSWLHWIEAEFAALRYFSLRGTDHRSHAEQNAAIGAYIRWHNTRAEPKTGFATDSRIRTWTNSRPRLRDDSLARRCLPSAGIDGDDLHATAVVGQEPAHVLGRPDDHRSVADLHWWQVC